MARMRCSLAVLLLALLTTDLRAQIVVGPPLSPYSGVAFGYRGRNFSLAGYVGGPVYPLMPYGIVQSRVTVQYATPTVVVAPRRAAAVAEYDLSGVDLDVVPPSAIWGEAPPRREAARP